MRDLVSVSSLGLDAARQAAAETRKTAESLNISVCIAVTDVAGNLISYDRMNGAPLMCGQIAQDKAYTVATFGRPTDEWWEMIRHDPALCHGVITVDRAVIYGGGVPVLNDDRLVGAIGVSGGSCEEDRLCAEAGAKAVADMLQADPPLCGE